MEGRKAVDEVRERNRVKGPRSFRVLAFIGVTTLFVYAIVSLTLHSYELYSHDSEGGSWPGNVLPMKIIQLIILPIFLPAFVLGVAASWRSDRIYYYWSSFAFLGLGTLFVILGIVCLKTSREDLRHSILENMRKGLREDFKWLDRIQKKEKCCGILGPFDWMEINATDNVSVPSSCCKTQVDLNCGLGILAPNDNDTEMEGLGAVIYNEGCGHGINSRAHSSLLLLGIEMLIAALFCYSLQIFLFCGASELFCFKAKGRRSRASDPDSGSATSIYLEEDMEEFGDTDDIFSAGGTGGGGSERRNSSSSGGSAHGGKFKKRKSRTNGVRLDARGKLTKDDAGGGGGLSQGGDGKVRTSAGQKVKGKGHPKFGGSAKVQNALNNNVESGKRFRPRQDLLLQQKLEMLFECADRNVSTLSTTPNPSGSLFFPWSHPLPPSGNSPPPQGQSQGQKVSVKLPGLHHYSSVPQLGKPHPLDHNLNLNFARELMLRQAITTPKPAPKPVHAPEPKVATPNLSSELLIETSIPPSVPEPTPCLNVPDDVPPLIVEVTNVVNLIAEEVLPGIITDEVDTSVAKTTVSDSSLGFERSLSGASSSSSESILLSASNDLNFKANAIAVSNMAPLRQSKSKGRFPTLPTILECDEPSGSAQTTPETGSDEILELDGSKVTAFVEKEAEVTILSTTDNFTM